MRPALLNRLFADVTALDGIGPKLAPLLAKVAGPRLVDLVLTLPTGVIDRSYRPTIAAAEEDRLATLIVQVDRHDPPPAGRKSSPWKVLCSDQTGYLTLTFFRPNADWLKRQLPEGATRLISGKIETYAGQRQMSHPDYILNPEKTDELPLIEPVYPLTAGLVQKTMQKAVRQAVARVPHFPEWQRADVLAKEGWPSTNDALSTAHAPASKLDLTPGSLARQRLAYDELLSNQLALALVRSQRTSIAGRALVGDGELVAAARKALPYALTGAQEAAVAAIVADMSAPSKMLRLLQGDVGSGKTVVALLALLTAIEAGAQAVLMAPTEILARQPFETIAPIAETLNIACVLITGRDKGAERGAKREGIRKGYANSSSALMPYSPMTLNFMTLGLLSSMSNIGLALPNAYSFKTKVAQRTFW